MYKLRDHQTVVYSEIRKSISNGKRKILVHAPVGFGKTVLAFEIAKNAIEKGNSVLMTTHRIQLNQQTYNKFKMLKPSYLQGNSKLFDKDNLLQIATLQTLQNRKINDPKVIIIDEVHYSFESNLVQSLFSRFQDAIFIGLSATPLTDEGYLLDGFDCIVDNYDLSDLIDLGFLVDFDYYCEVTPDVSNVKIKGNDYDELELEPVLIKHDFNRSIVDNYIKHGNDKKFLCFALNKKHCEELYFAFKARKIDVGIITAETPEKEREQLLLQHKQGNIKGIINIEILTTGYDDGSIGCLVFATPTKSYRKFIQMAGRGCRLNGNSIGESILNGKERCIFIDCAGLIMEHDLPTKKRKFEFKKTISNVIDKHLGINDDNEKRIGVKNTMTEEKRIFLKKIGSILDLYDGKVYTKESDLQDDVNNFLSKTNYFWYRQNSGKMYKDGRWVHFASKSGLPDNSVYYRDTSFYFGLELKLKHGKLTQHQKETLPEMISKNVLFFICESVFDVYRTILHVEEHISVNEENIIVNRKIFNVPEWQVDHRNKLKL